MPMKAYCSPELLQGKSAIKKLSDIKKKTLLHDQPGNDYWQEWFLKAGLIDRTADNQREKGPVIIDPNVRIQSAIDGQGLLLANPMLQDEIDRGELVEPFEHIQLEGLAYYLIVKKQAYQSNALKLFSDWLFDQMNHKIRVST